MSVLKLGLIADSSIQLRKLESLVEYAGYAVGAALLSTNSSEQVMPEVDVWVVRVDMQSEKSIALMERLEDEPVPVIYDDAESYTSLDPSESAKRFSRKVNTSNKLKPNSASSASRARRVWVLAASTGGPDAVVTFIKNLPADLEDVAFIYVQHIDERMSESLQKVIARNTQWEVFSCDQPQRLNAKSFYIVSPEHQVDLDDMGCLIPVAAPWEGPYSPSVDQVLAKVAKKFGKDSGAIIFSGMGDDGAKTCRLLALAGGKVWVQAPSSCAVDSMPQEAIATESVSFIGTPELLAREFVASQRNI